MVSFVLWLLNFWLELELQVLKSFVLVKCTLVCVKKLCQNRCRWGDVEFDLVLKII